METNFPNLIAIWHSLSWGRPRNCKTVSERPPIRPLWEKASYLNADVSNQISCYRSVCMRFCNPLTNFIIIKCVFTWKMECLHILDDFRPLLWITVDEPANWKRAEGSPSDKWRPCNSQRRAHARWFGCFWHSSPSVTLASPLCLTWRLSTPPSLYIVFSLDFCPFSCIQSFISTYVSYPTILLWGKAYRPLAQFSIIPRPPSPQGSALRKKAFEPHQLSLSSYQARTHCVNTR